MRIRQLLLINILLVISLPLLLSCGKKGNPVAPRAFGPQAVKRFQAAARSGGIMLMWKPPTRNTDKMPLLDLESFKIFREEVRFEDRCRSCPKNFVTLFEYAYKGPRGKVPERELFFYTDRDIKPRHVYTYKIECLNEGGMLGAASNIVTVFWDVPPSPPTSLNVERKGRYSVLAWESPALLEDGTPPAEIAGFNIYRSLQQGVYENAPLNAEPVAETTFQDMPETYDQTYFYTVRTVRKVIDSFIESAPSAENSLLFSDITAPSAPQGLTAIPSREGMLLKWVAKSERGVAGYHVYRKEPGGRDFIRINRELIQANSWVDTSAHTGKQYIYAVTAVDESLQHNESPLSEPVTILHLP